MSVVAPSTIVRFLKGVPLESTYENTVYWETTEGATRAVQAETFAKYTKAPVTDTDGKVYNFYIDKLSYQRYGRNQIKVAIPMDMLLDCNYMMFNNARFGSKWFYAFITKLEYVSEVTTIVSYEIDVLQTWFFDYHPNACFIERAHAYSDIIGKNLVREDFELGEMVFKSEPITSRQLKDVGYYIVAPWKAEIIYGEQGEREINITPMNQGIYISGVYSGVWINRFTNIEDVKAVLDVAAGESGDLAQAVVSIYCAPYYAGSDADYVTTSISCNNDVTLFGQYQPHNKKLYTYPYRAIQAFNGNGGSHTYRYEYFDGARNAKVGLPSWNCMFRIRCDGTPGGTCYLVPVGYKYKATSAAENWYESMDMGGYSTIAYTTDAFKQWLAQDGVVQVLGNINPEWTKDEKSAREISFGVKAFTGAAKAVGGIASIASGAPMSGIGGIASGVSGVLDTITEYAQAENMPNNTQGVAGNSLLKMSLNKQQFQIGQMSITEPFAKRIDEFWDWFGYSQKTVQTPNRHARTHWTYLKTQGCTINGSIPADDERRICELYDNGVRWWTALDKIGQFYNLAPTNHPLGDAVG